MWGFAAGTVLPRCNSKAMWWEGSLARGAVGTKDPPCLSVPAPWSRAASAHRESIGVRRSLYMLLCCAVLNAFGGCAEPTTRIRDGRAVARAEAAAAAADRDLRAARDAAQSGGDEAARRILERFLGEFADCRRADEAAFLLAEIYLRGGDAERAARTWRELIERAPLSRLAAGASLRRRPAPGPRLHPPPA